LKSNKNFDLKVGDLIEYNYKYNKHYLYDIENKIGIILDISEDENKHTCLKILISNNIELLPIPIILYKKV